MPTSTSCPCYFPSALIASSGRLTHKALPRCGKAPSGRAGGLPCTRGVEGGRPTLCAELNMFQAIVFPIGVPFTSNAPPPGLQTPWLCLVESFPSQNHAPTEAHISFYGSRSTLKLAFLEIKTCHSFQRIIQQQSWIWVLFCFYFCFVFGASLFPFFSIT